MEREPGEPLDRVIAAMVRIPAIMVRKLHREVIQPALEEVGMDFAPHHMAIMKALGDGGESHMSEVGDMMGIAKAQMTHSVDRLIASGMVARASDIEDRRKVDIRLTAEGRDTVKRLDKIIEDRMRAKLACLDDDELERLADSFDYIANAFSKLQ
jgi:DNA-binding MarR family transcriptional regulator